MYCQPIKKGSSTRLLYLLLFFFVVACDHSEETVDPVVPPDSCSLTGIEGAGYTVGMVYNDEGLMIQQELTDLDGDNDKIRTIEYDNNKNVIKISQDDGYIDYVYTNNRVIAGSIYYRTDVAASFVKLLDIRYTYNVKGQMDSAIYSNDRYNRYEYNEEGYWINAYLKEAGQPENLAVQNIKFDNNRIPESSYFSHYTLLVGKVIELTSLNLPLPNQHNIETSKVRLNNGDIATYQYSYTYNELGYPTSVTFSGYLGGPSKQDLHYTCK